MNANGFGDSLDAKLRDAAEFLDAGQKKEARKVLREALNIDRNNLATWELLLRATYNVNEEIHCLKRILAIDPNHESAKRRLKVLQSSSTRTPKRSSSRKKRRESILLLLFLGSLVSIICVGIAGFTLMRGGYIPFSFPDTTATALAQKNASCQALINRALLASGDYCGNTGSNKACYGNTKIKADLAPDSTQRFSERGDIVAINELSRLTASPLSIDGNEWGIAVFKLIANLPRSLPGETVTMVVFGNATLDNTSGNSENLESFYFTSELGQIACEKVPFDGLMITSPDGSGARFTINETELTIMGTASIKAIKNGEMEVSVYKGSARIVSQGEEQYVGAGQKSSVKLGGEDGNQSISPPSKPEPLSQEELAISCTMTGKFCMQGEIIPLSEEQAQEQIESQITSTPTLTLTPSLTYTPSSTVPATYTLLVLPTSTYTPGPTSTRAPTKTRAPADTPLPTNTPLTLPTPTRTNTPITPTLTFTSSPVPPTPAIPNEPTCTSVSLANMNITGNDLIMNIVNDSGTPVTIDRFFSSWVKSSPSQGLDRIFLDGNLIWNTSDPNTPTEIPTEGNWRTGFSLTIPSSGSPGLSFVVRFKDIPQAGSTEVHIIFDAGCQVIGNK